MDVKEHHNTMSGKIDPNRGTSPKETILGVLKHSPQTSVILVGYRATQDIP